MTILVADYIYIDGHFIEDKAIAFSDKIEAIDEVNNLLKLYPNATIINSQPNSVIYPGFINTHVHLEFSANKTSLKYGSFMPWLDSVITHRDDLVKDCDNNLMMNECNEMLKSGVSTFGAISSFGTELEVCEKTPQRVVFFNELIGSNAMYADMLFNDFKERVLASQNCDLASKVTPAIAIHSAYSVHPVILQKAITIAKQNSMPLSAHFLESQSEREWLENGQGEFKEFFEKFFNTSTPVTNIEEFLHSFDSYKTHFTHCVQASQDELDYLANKGHTIAHCPRSNRYLGCGRLPVENLNLPFTTATDGLSSNDSLNILDELRSALMLHNEIPIEHLANTLIESVTKNAALALNLNCGELKVNKLADIAVIELPQKPVRKEEIALWTILHTKEVSSLFIDGKQEI